MLYTKKLSLLLLAVFLLPASTYSIAAVDKIPQAAFDWKNTHKIPQMLKQGLLTADKIPNPHWQENACLACHTKNIKKTLKKLPKKMDEAICQNCHDARFDHSYIHPVNVTPDKAMAAKMNPNFKASIKKSGGKVSCFTCHEMKLQCLPKYKKKQIRNPKFFRGSPFKTRSEQCYFCHDATDYQTLNPHDQIDDAGNIRDNTCRICHAGSIDQLKQQKPIDPVEFHAKENLESLCWGCHRWIPHPGGSFTFFSSKKGPNHLKKLPQDILERFLQQSEEHNILLPLEPGTGRVYCATCHNPHEKGVINNAADATGVDTKKRLRAKNICPFCHLK
ncbi:MAG: hypothetical protein ABUK13_00260 [Gammaproteobacteria bacterium]